MAELSGEGRERLDSEGPARRLLAFLVITESSALNVFQITEVWVLERKGLR